MILKCPRDGTELNPGTWNGMMLDLVNDRTTYTWDRCEGTPVGEPGHLVSVTWIGRKPEVIARDIVAVPLAKSHIPNRGLSPSPFAPSDPAPSWAGMPKMTVVKRRPQ